MLFDLFLILVGLGLLVEGGDYLVKGAVAIAERAHISHMVIGLTIVAFGTSAPELLVSLTSALTGSSGIALGNVVGSNIANIALILGTTAIVKAAPTSRRTLRVDMPYLLLASLLLFVVAYDGSISRWNGIVAFLMLVGFVVWQVRSSRAAEAPVEAEADMSATPSLLQRHLWLAIVVSVASLAALSYGADWLVAGASGIARLLGVSDRVIGLTIVAIGTSLPELFASIMAARRGETDMAIGNIIGSNLFNILCVLGLTTAICPIASGADNFLSDYVWMNALTALLLLFLFTRRLLERWEGGVLLALYVVYLSLTLLS